MAPSLSVQERRKRTNALTERIIGCAYVVSNTLGTGFLEKVYENALAIEMRRAGLNVQQQYPITVTYRGQAIGSYVADLYVEDLVLVELKMVETVEKIHLAQCLNYLKATGLRLCLLLSFQNPEVEIQRVARNF